MLQLKPEGLDLADLASRPIAVGGRQLIADKSGALYWPGERALLVADLGLVGAGANGSPDGARQILTRLAEAMDRYDPTTVIVIGQQPSPDGAAALSPEDGQILRILQEDRDWIWVTGHTDRPAPPELGGSSCGMLEMGGLALRARPAPGWASQDIAASMHPAAHLLMYGYSLRRACFVANRHRLLMPAFGTPAGGVNVLDPAFRPLLGDAGMAVWMLGEEGLYPVAARLLVED